MATRRAEDAVAKRQASVALTEDPTREGAGSSVGGGGGSRAGKTGLVSQPGGLQWTDQRRLW